MIIQKTNSVRYNFLNICVAWLRHMITMLPPIYHCDCEICEWLNCGIFLKFPCIMWIYAWFLCVVEIIIATGMPTMLWQDIIHVMSDLICWDLAKFQRKWLRLLHNKHTSCRDHTVLHKTAHCKIKLWAYCVGCTRHNQSNMQSSCAQKDIFPYKESGTNILSAHQAIYVFGSRSYDSVIDAGITDQHVFIISLQTNPNEFLKYEPRPL